jgi:DNA-binding transcriptional MerR regulator
MTRAHENRRFGAVLRIVHRYDPVLRKDRLTPAGSSRRSGHRRYDGGILSWIKFVERMKASGMPIKDIINYTALWKRGSGTEAERRELLEKQRQRVQARIAELRSCQRVIDEKVLNLIKLERG